MIIVDSVEYEYVNDVTCGKFMGRELQNFITGDYSSFFTRFYQICYFQLMWNIFFFYLTYRDTRIEDRGKFFMK